MQEIWIGLDGTDSPHGGCTTWTMSNIVDLLAQKSDSIEFLDYPYLIRLNPNIPEKTRGNGALALHLRTNLKTNEVFDLCKHQIIKDQENYKLNPDKLPGLIVTDKKISTDIYHQALVNYLSTDIVSFLSDFKYIWPELNQSHIGAASAIAADLSQDYTFELLSYRFLHNCDNQRKIAEDSIKKASQRYKSTFSSYDYQQNRELIAPSGPDPVFCGIRGELPSDLRDYFQSLTIHEELQSYTIFKTNQATNAHIKHVYNKSSLPSSNCKISHYEVVKCLVTVLETPREIKGGHLFAKCLFNDKTYQLSWFEPTKDLRNQARNLISGDKIYIHGAFMPHKKGNSIHVEFMRMVEVSENDIIKPPICNCGERMTSAGAFAGYKCKNCGTSSKFPEVTTTPRHFFPNQQIYAASSAQRHLTRPEKRRHVRNREVIHQKVNYNSFREIF